MQKRIKIPSQEFQKDEYQSIRSILGNDIFIESFNKNEILLPNNYILVDVKYQHIDFNTFDIILVDNPKQLNLNSDKYIVIYQGKYIKLIKPSKDKFWIKIYANKQEVTNDKDIDIHYYGIEIKKPKDILHSFISIFGINKLSYHGTTINTNLIFFKNPLNEDIDPKKECKFLKEFNVVEKNYTNSYIDVNSFKIQDPINDLSIVTLKEQPKCSCIIDFNNSSKEELKKYLLNLKKGYIILTQNRNPTSLIYIKNCNYTLGEKEVDYIILTISLDLENLEKFVKSK